MIEVIQSDFARLEAETTASEGEASKQYEEFMNDSKVDKTQKTADLDHKTASKQNQEQALQETKIDQRHSEGTHCCRNVLREVEACLRGFRSPLRGPRGQAKGGNRVPPGSFEDPQRRRCHLSTRFEARYSCP